MTATEGVLKKLEDSRVNFIDFTSKKKDWRYETYFRLSLARDQQEAETIYWIGSINLEDIDVETKTVNVSFLELATHGSGLSAQTDAYRKRYEDGKAHQGNSALYEYSVSDEGFKKELLEAKKNGLSYFHFCAEETVDYFGDHVVYLLYNLPQQTGYSKVVRGLGSHKPLIEESIQFYSQLAFGYIDEKTERLPLLSHTSYHWHK